MTGSIIFWLSYIVSAISMYFQLRCTYVGSWGDEPKDYVKQKYPILVYLILIILWFLPVINVIATFIVWAILGAIHGDKISVHNFLFKKI